MKNLLINSDNQFIKSNSALINSAGIYDVNLNSIVADGKQVLATTNYQSVFEEISFDGNSLLENTKDERYLIEYNSTFALKLTGTWVPPLKIRIRHYADILTEMDVLYRSEVLDEVIIHDDGLGVEDNTEYGPDFPYSGISKIMHGNHLFVLEPEYKAEYYFQIEGLAGKGLTLSIKGTQTLQEKAKWEL